MNERFVDEASSVRVEAHQMARAEALMVPVGRDPVLRESIGRMSRAAILRLALTEGLNALERRFEPEPDDASVLYWRQKGLAAATAGWWRWLPGMLARDRATWRQAQRVVHIERMPRGAILLGVKGEVNEDGEWSGESIHARNFAPDISDAATLGCLQELARRAWKDRSFYAYLRSDRKTWDAATTSGYRTLGPAANEAELYLTALDAAP